MAKNANSSRKPSDAADVDPQPNGVQPAAPVAAEGTPPGDDAPAKVTVIAREPIAELIDGEIRRFAKGDMFILDRDRALALRTLVAIQDPPSAA